MTLPMIALGWMMATTSSFALTDDYRIPTNGQKQVRSATYVRASSTDQGVNERLDDRVGAISLFDAIGATGSNGSGQTSFFVAPLSQPWRMSLDVQAEGRGTDMLPGGGTLQDTGGIGQAVSARRYTFTARSNDLPDGTVVEVQANFLASAAVGLTGRSGELGGTRVGNSRVSVYTSCFVLRDFVNGLSMANTIMSNEHLVFMGGETSSANFFRGNQDRTGVVGFRDETDLSNSRNVGTFLSSWAPNSGGNVIVGSGVASASGQVITTANFVFDIEVGETVEIFVELGLSAIASGGYDSIGDYPVDGQANASFTGAGTLDFSSDASVFFEINGVGTVQPFDILDYGYDPVTSAHTLTIDVLDGVTYESEYSFNLQDWFPLQPLFFGGLGVQQTSVFAPVSEDGRVFLKVIGNR